MVTIEPFMTDAVRLLNVPVSVVSTGGIIIGIANSENFYVFSYFSRDMTSFFSLLGPSGTPTSPEGSGGTLVKCRGMRYNWAEPHNNANQFALFTGLILNIRKVHNRAVV